MGLAIDTLAFGGVPIAPGRCGRKPAFIQVNKAFTATRVPFAQTQEPPPFHSVGFPVSPHFFYGSHPAAAYCTKCNAATPQRHAQVPRASGHRVSRYRPDSSIMECTTSNSLFMKTHLKDVKYFIKDFQPFRARSVLDKIFYVFKVKVLSGALHT